MKLNAPVAPGTLCPLCPQQAGHRPQNYKGRVLLRDFHIGGPWYLGPDGHGKPWGGRGGQ